MTKIDVFANKICLEPINILTIQTDTPAIPDFLDYENMVLNGKIDLDFCESFCKSNGKQMNYQITNYMMCKLLRIYLDLLHNYRKTNVINNFNYHLGVFYNIRGLTRHGDTYFK